MTPTPPTRDFAPTAGVAPDPRLPAPAGRPGSRGFPATRRRWLNRPRNLVLTALALVPLSIFAVAMMTETLRAYSTIDDDALLNAGRRVGAAVDAQFSAMTLTAAAIAQSEALDGLQVRPGFEAQLARQTLLFNGWAVLLGPAPDYPVLVNSGRRPDQPLPAALSATNVAALAPQLRRVYAEGEPAVSDLFVGGMARRPIVTVMVPVDRPGLPRRALALSFGPELLATILHRQSLPAGLFAGIADGQGNLVAVHPAPPVLPAGRPTPPWITAALEDREQALVSGPGMTGEDNVYAAVRLGTAPGWRVVVGQPVQARQAATWRAALLALAGILSTALALGVLVWVLRREAVTGLRREAEALRAGQAQVERLHGGLPAMIFHRQVAPDGSSRPIYRGGPEQAVAGWPEGTLWEVEDWRARRDPDEPGFEELLRQTLRDGAATQVWRLRQPDGGWRWMRTDCRRLGGDEVRGGHVVGYLANITAEREAQARAMTSARLASLGEMAAGLAHELKQPLQAIVLLAENAQLADASRVTHRRLDAIIEQSLRAGEIIEHLRRFARGSQEGAERRPVRLDQVVAAALSLMGPALRDAMIELRLSLGTPPLAVLGDQLALEQVMTNLLLNARDALQARPKSTPRTIDVEARLAAPDRVALRVADNGGGIAASVLDHLFEPFVTTKSLEQGTGLGLSVCHGLVAAMGGTIEAANAEGGAVFTITLPAARAADVVESPGGRVQRAGGKPVKA
jgi:C4-dicarboxylate-specific signal transduction histidine kinase